MEKLENVVFDGKTAYRHDLAIRKDESFKSSTITCSTDCYRVIKQFYKDDLEIYESFFILLLNRAKKTIGWVKISQGGVSATVVDAKIVAIHAVKSMASSIVLAHNHPSGNTTPSRQDIALTKKLKEGLELLDINVLDHIILTSNSYYSFMDEGMM